MYDLNTLRHSNRHLDNVLSFNHISRLIIQYYNWVGLEFNKQENISVKEQSVFVWHVKQK